jgi:hypothetical protein
MNNSKPGDDGATSASRPQILRATLWAVVAAAVLVVAIILPAEYGIDLSGFGKLTGLNALAVPKASAPPAAADVPLAAGAAASSVAMPLTVWASSQAEKFTTQTYEITMQGDEEFEYKANMNRGESLLYSWRVKEGSQVYFEFHGEPTTGTWPKDYYESYQKGEARSGQGSMVAPFTGHHGWYWLNLSDKPITIVVELAGYYRQFAKIGAPQQLPVQ